MYRSILTTETIRDLQVSESGRLAYWVIRPSLESDQYVSRLMVKDAPEQHATVWTEVVGTAVGLAWTNHETLCYALGKTVWEIKEAGNPGVLCTLEHPILEFSLVPGTLDVICSVRPAPAKTGPTVVTSLPIKQDGRGRLTTNTELVHIRDGMPWQRMVAARDVWHPRVSPDGKYLAFLERGAGVKSLLDAALYIIALDDWKTAKVLIDVPRLVSDMAWAPDSQGLSVLAADGTIGIPQPTELWLYRKGATAHRVMVSGAQWIGVSGGGDWAYLAKSVTHFWLNATEIILNESSQGHVQLIAVDARSGVARPISSGMGNYTSACHRSSSGNIFAVYEDSTSLHEVVKVSRTSDQSLTKHNPVQFPKPEEYQIPSWDGNKIHTFVLPAEGPRRGTILSIHGGPHGAFSRSVHFLHNKLATAGFTVIYANPHGSIGYGKAFAQALAGHWGELDEQDWAAIVDYFEQAGVLDRQRLGVLGASYGGFMATWLAGSWPFLRTAVIQAPVADQVGMFWTSDIGYTFTAYGCEVDIRTPDEALEKLWSNSPLRRFGSVEASVLLLHGEQDDRCPVGQSESLFTALKLADKDVEWALYPGESHLMSTLGRPSTRMDRVNRICDWLIARYPIL